MGGRGLVVVVLLTSCSTSEAGRSSNLLPTLDAAAGAPASRLPGDPLPAGAADSGGLPADGGAATIRPDASAGDVVLAPADAPTADAALALADAPAADASTSPTPADAPAPAADATSGEVGVTWDANQTLTDCGVTPRWQRGTSYAKLEFALNHGHIFQCLGDPPYRLDCKSPDYEPGKPGGPWPEAWFDSGRCR